MLLDRCIPSASKIQQLFQAHLRQLTVPGLIWTVGIVMTNHFREDLSEDGGFTRGWSKAEDPPHSSTKYLR